MKTQALLIISLMLLLATPLAVRQTTADPTIEDTHLLITMDTAWDHTHPGDTFVIRTLVKNIGTNPAVYTIVKLNNIPDDWHVQPRYKLIPLLFAGQSKPLFFIVERGQPDATVYSSAEAFNAPLVQSNHIAIPISPFVLIPFGLICGVIAFSHYKQRRIKNP